MVTTLAGLVGGLLGSIAMTAAARATGDEPWPSAVAWAMYLGDGDPANYGTAGLAVHLVYGAFAGALFAGLSGALSPGLASLGAALLWSVGWAVVLTVVAVGVWLRVFIGAGLETGALARVVGLHLVYGVVLGLVVYALPGL